MDKLAFLSKITAPDTIAWDELYLKCNNPHPRQHYSFAEVVRASGRIPIFVIGYRGKCAAFAGLFGLRRFISSRLGVLEAVCERGPLFLDCDSLKKGMTEVVLEFRRQRVGRVIVSPYCRFPEAGGFAEILNECGLTSEGGQAECSGVIELKQTEDELLARLSKSTRYQIRLADREKINFTPATTLTDTRCFIKQLVVMHRQRGLFKINEREFEGIYRVIQQRPSLGVIMNAFLGTKFAGGILVLSSHRVAVAARFVIVPEVLRETSNLSLAPGLWWKAIQWSRASGCDTFDVEGYREDTESSNPLHDIYQSKKRLKPIRVDRLMPFSCELNPVIARFAKTVDRFITLSRRIDSRFHCNRT